MNILVTGCKGQLGTELQKIADPCHHWFFTDVDTLDICDETAVEAYFEAHEIEVCINCAAYTAVDKAEDEPDLAEKINVFAPQILAETCLKHHALLVHISTDYVFGGDAQTPYRVSDPINPQSVYGSTKAEGEKRIMTIGCNYFIVRTAWLYSSTGKNFVKTMLNLADTRDEINVVADQKGCPTWAHDLAVALVTLVNQNGNQPVQEVFHFTNEGQITWYDFTLAIIEIGGKHCKVNPITTDQYPTKAKRPAYSVLDLSKIKEYAGIEIPDWRESLVKCIEQLSPVGATGH
ncbi:MAG: dTDP-4-dehydrorhamnose reductase [Bacteroidales bacterium]|nr:dTDP-4-dehydrorhamnose reductase [Bacteroidales bacterium]